MTAQFLSKTIHCAVIHLIKSDKCCGVAPVSLYYNEIMNNRTSSSSSDYETTPKFMKCFGENINAKFDVFMKTRCDFIIEADN